MNHHTNIAGRAVRLTALAVALLLLAGCAAGSNGQQGAANGAGALDIYGEIMQLDLGASPYSTDYRGTMLVEVGGVSDSAHTFGQAQLAFYKDTGMFQRNGDELTPVPFDELAVGMQVEVRIDGPIAESYPVQARAGQIVIAAAAPDASTTLNDPDEGGDAPQSDWTRERLDAVNSQIGDYADQLREQHGLTIQSWGTGADHIMMQIRSYGEVERVVTDEDVEQFRQSLFEYVGEQFPLELGVRRCCDGPGDVTGVVSEVDMEQKRLLIVDDTQKNGNTDNPVAVWVGLSEDGVLVRAGGGEAVSFDEISAGQAAVAWSIGVQLDSYPAQTSAVKIEIGA